MLFSQVSAVAEHEGGVFEACIDPSWSIAGRPNGGYLLAILGRAAGAVVPQPHVLTASAVYLRPPGFGAATVRTEVLRAGRSASQVRATMVQDGKSCVEALFTVGTVGRDVVPFWDRATPLPAIAGREECVRAPRVNPTGVPVPINGEVDLRLDPAVLGFARGNPSGAGELRGWLALPGDEPFDPVALLYAVDALPPGTFEIATSGWVPTLELTCYVRGLPAPGPVRVLQRARLVAEDRFDELCTVWDSAGRLVAQATQLAGVRFG
ncbi:MAG: thioesterase family protein [Jatrophihabitans sp.]|nr:MAG: thioesterase family protein [Jatrophihabitans sp.]